MLQFLYNYCGDGMHYDNYFEHDETKNFKFYNSVIKLIVKRVLDKQVMIHSAQLTS